ncbi:hypothetical protein [uncultured Sulfitobacter sp.]|uniref:hypothetical protein n=1 Tax=uncultured Sulfitobacter sp. TaxID=191468 RepID=UPI0026094F56|nr:hypothetical protein [uncultured Sulfitobacter sp.]
MSSPATYPFTAEKDELIEMIHDMGPDFFFGTLDAVLMEANGGLVSHGVTLEMYEGQAISSVTAVDMIAVALGESATMLDAGMLAVAETYAEDIREIEGIADLAERTLKVFSEDAHPIYGKCTGELGSRAAFHEILNPLKDTIASAKLRHPAEWVESDAQGMFEVTMYPDDEGVVEK